MKRISWLLIIPIVAYTGVSSLWGTAEDDALFVKAKNYFFERKFEMAQLLLQETIKKNPENGDAYSYLADIYLFKKRYDAALNLYKKALDLDPTVAENYFRIGQVYYYKKMGQDSIDNFSKSYELDSGLKYAQFHLGLSFLMLKRDKEKTIEHWEKFLEIAPEDPQYENIKRVIELLRDPNFVIPPLDSEVSIEEALHLGGITLKPGDHKTSDKTADHEDMKFNKKIKDIYLDDDM